MLGEGLFTAPSSAVPRSRPAQSWLTARPHTGLLVLAGVALALLTGAVAALDLKIAVAMVPAVALVVVVLAWPIVGGLVLVAIVPIISGLAPGFPVRDLRPAEALVGVVGITLLVGARRRDAVPWGALDWLVLAYGVAWFAFAAYNDISLQEHLTLSDWGSALGQLQFFLIYRGVRVAVRTPRQRRVALGALLIASVPVAALAVLQQLNVPGIRSLLYAGTGSSNATIAAAGTVSPLSLSSLHRATGPFDNWTSLAGFFVPLLLVMASLALANQVGRRRLWYLGIAIAATGGLLVSDEQSAIIAVAAGLVALGILHGRTRRVLAWLAVGVVAATVFFGPTIAQRVVNELTPNAEYARPAVLPQTLGYRDHVWTGQYIPAIEQRPLSGYGVVIPATIVWPYTESQYVAVLMEGGLPLLLIFGALTWASIGRSRRLTRSPDPFERAMGHALTVSLVVLVVMDIVWPYLSDGGLPQVLWALLGLAEVTATSTMTRLRWHDTDATMPVDGVQALTP